MSPTVQRLLGHDQAPAHSQRSVPVPVHRLPGLLPQPGLHAEAHKGPQAGGRAGGLEDRKDLPVRLLRLSRTWTPRTHTLSLLGENLVTPVLLFFMLENEMSLCGFKEIIFRLFLD